MCALCAALAGERYWTDAAGRESFAKDGEKLTRRTERLRRLQAVNRVLIHYRLEAMDWGGSVFRVGRIGGGEALMADHLNGIWAAARTLSGVAIDPLDPDFLAALEP